MKIIHISDLHFGRDNHLVTTALLNDINLQSPNLVIVSGDLTQRARKKQFIKAADFFQKISFPKLIVPGNHDVPLFDVTRRFLAPFNRYIRYINKDFFPCYSDDLVTVLGINTAYSFTWKSGRVSASQLQVVAEKFNHLGEKIRILVVHHPFHEIFTNKDYFEKLNEIKLDLILSGHLHQSSARPLSSHVSNLNDKTLLVQAGTAISTRLRKENNSYNLIQLHARDELDITINEFDTDLFIPKKQQKFIKRNGKWLVQ